MTNSGIRKPSTTSPIDHAHTADRDRPHGELRMPGQTQLAHHKNIERHIQFFRHLRADRARRREAARGQSRSVLSA